MSTKQDFIEAELRALGLRPKLAKKPRPAVLKLKINDVVTPLSYLSNEPGLPRSGTRLVVKELHKQMRKVRTVKADGGPGTWWFYHEDVQKLAKPK